MSTVIWLLVALCVRLGGAQFTVKEPSSQAVPTGGNVSLSCSSPSATLYYWWVGAPPNRAGITASGVSLDGAQLNISSFHAADHAGLYSCMVALPGANAIFTCPANISHARIATHFVRSPSSMDAPVGSTVVLHCQPPYSNPPPLIQWKKDGAILQTDSRITILPTGNLYILNVTQADSGDYRCMATNLVSDARRRSVIATLNITDILTNSTPPIITLPPTNTEAIVGENITLECAATGHPTPSIFWERVFSRTFPRSDHVLSSGALSIGPVMVADAGRYRCIAENSEGMVQADAIITVKVPPQVTISPLPTFLTVGDSVNLTCVVNATDPVTVTWSLSTTVLFSETVTPSSPSSALNVSVSSSSNGKIYQCMALNHLGCSHDQVRLVVSQPATTLPTTGGVSPPSFTFPPFTLPPVTTPPTSSTPFSVEITTPNVTFLPGMTASLQCVATSSPLPTILWLVNGSPAPLNLQRDQTFGDSVRFSTLTVSQEGDYTCIARSGNNVKTAVVEVKAAPSTPVPSSSPSPSPSPTPEVTTPPEPSEPSTNDSSPSPAPILQIKADIEQVQVLEGQPLSLGCSVIAGTALNISWLFGAAPAPGRHTVRVAQEGQLLGKLELDAVTTEHGGQFVCVAVGSQQEQSSAIITVTVRNSPPSAAPNNVKAMWLSSGHIRVQWDALNSSLLSPLAGYKLNWEPLPNVAQSARAAVPPTQHQYEVTTGLDQRNSYTILVWGYSNGGDGPPARLRLRALTPPTTAPPTTAPPTTPPPSTTVTPTTDTVSRIIDCRATSPTEIQLRWQATDPTLSYKLIYGCNKANAEQEISLDPAVTMETLTHLLPQCEYWLVVGWRSGQALVLSDECNVTTPNGQIDIDAQVQWLPNGSVVVRWSLPASLWSHASLEIRIGGGRWEPISSGAHLLAELDPSRPHDIELRVNSAQWQGSVNLTLHSTPTTAPTTAPTTDLGLLYGAIFATLIIACVIVVMAILVLKYVQMTRRDTDKVVNHREEAFKRMSMQRSSVNSIKKMPLQDYKANGTIHKI